jgi:hypothetical protein
MGFSKMTVDIDFLVELLDAAEHSLQFEADLAMWQKTATCWKDNHDEVQADLTCRSEQYRQAVALIQVQREEIAAKDKEIARLNEENIGLRKEIACVNRQTYDSGRTLLGLENYQLRTNIEAKDKEIARLRDALESLVHFNCCADCALVLKLRFAKQALKEA